MGPEVLAFENELLQFLRDGREASLSQLGVACVSTGTSALHLAGQAIGLQPGDEVLVPTFTYVASFQAVSATGAIPVACDVDPRTGLLDFQDAARRVTARTKAVLYVHYAGEPGDLDSLYAFSARFGLRTIEDAAHSFGGAFRGRRIGTLGDVVCFSFDAIKNLTSGEGGAVVTSDAQVLRLVKAARRLGLDETTQDVYAQGWRYHMSDLMAAIGRAQLARFSAELAPKRVALANQYAARLSVVSGVEPLPRSPESVPHIFPVRVLAGKRDGVRAALADARIETGLHYRPNHLLAYYRRDGAPLPAAEKLYAELLTLPLHPGLLPADVDEVVDIIAKALT